MKKVLSYKLRVTSYNSFLTLLLSCFLTVSYGQISTGEEPVSFRRAIPVLMINEATHKIMPELDMVQIEQEDLQDEENGVIPRFGYKHEVSYNLTNSGEWVELENGDKIWRLSISCPGATSINLLYDRFWLPVGAKFFIYGDDSESYLGAYTSKNNKGKKEDMRGFATNLLRGDHITLEYYLPKEANEMGIISISHVVHGYRLLKSPDNRGCGDSYGFGFNCSKIDYNVNCWQGSSWKDDIDAVVLMIVNGNRSATAALVNTTANGSENHHYLLTAHHCLTEEGYHGDPPFNLDTYSFWWHYESSTCDNPSTEPPHLSTQGATCVAGSYYGDFALLELDEDPTEAWDVMPYYLGWDNSGIAQKVGCFIHHPKGDIKKMGITSATVETFNYLHKYCSTGVGHQDLPTIWRFSWHEESSLPVNGSSGSPLLNADRKLIGIHRNTQYELNGNGHGGFWWLWFSKFSYAWEGYHEEGYCDSNPTTRLKDWLDPLNTDVTVCEGRGGCPKVIRLWKSLPASFQAVDTIISKQVLNSGSTTSYKAGEEILLINGFHAKPGSKFSATIEEYEACNDTTALSPANPNPEPDNDNATVLGIHNLSTSTITLFPNPTTGEFQVTSYGLPITNIEIFDIYGRNLSPLTSYPIPHTSLDVSHLQNGVYFVKIYFETGEVVVKRLVVMK